MLTDLQTLQHIDCAPRLTETETERQRICAIDSQRETERQRVDRLSKQSIIPADGGGTRTDPCNLQKGQLSKAQNCNTLVPGFDQSTQQQQEPQHVRSSSGPCTLYLWAMHATLGLPAGGCHNSCTTTRNSFVFFACVFYCKSIPWKWALFFFFLGCVQIPKP